MKILNLRCVKCVLFATLTIGLPCGATTCAVVACGKQSGATAVETGRFKIYMFEAPAGEETYEITRDGDSHRLQSNVAYSDRGNEITLATSLRTRGDLTPERFDVKGKTSLTEVNISVDVKDRVAHVVDGTQKSQVSAPERFFTLGGAFPISAQMMLFRYLAAHDPGAPLKAFPIGDVRFERRGQDIVEVGGKTVPLDHYAVSGVIWGRESVWIDDRQQIIAAITYAPSLEPIQAIREGYESALSAFLTRAAEDGIADLARITGQLSPPLTEPLAIVGGTVVDGTGRPPLTDATVLIQRDRIVATGPRTTVSVPGNAEVVDAHGKTILPGLWDMHAHHDQVEWGPLYLAAGVTSVRDCGNLVDFKVALRRAIQSGRGVGPRLLLAGLIDGVGPRAMGPIRAASPTEAIAAVNRLKQSGFEQIKIYSSVKPELVPVIAAEAHRLGMTVTGHVPEGMNVLLSLKQ